jgi:hypothetical protein
MIQLGIGAVPLAVPAATMETAVDQYLVSMPGDFYTISTDQDTFLYCSPVFRSTPVSVSEPETKPQV